jgi:tetratricopeptide (TPR) repeat protein
MNRTRPNKVRDIVRFMLEHNKQIEALKILQNAADNIRQTRDWLVLRQIWEQPQQEGDPVFTFEPVLLGQASWRILIGRILAGCEDNKTLGGWLSECLQKTGRLEPELVVLKAFVLICAGENIEAKRSLEAVLPELTGYWLGLAHQRLLWAQHRLQQPWEHHLLELRQHLEARALGLALLDVATCAYSDNHDKLAQTIAEEALEYLKDDAYHKARTNLQIGFNLLRVCNPNAEINFTESLTETFKPQGKPLRAKALAGIAAFRRFQGEWRISLEYYGRAYTTATEIKDIYEQHQIMLNKARTYRLSGNCNEAINILKDTLEQRPKDPSDFWLEMTAANLKLENNHEAQENFAHVTQVFGADVYLKTILEAELLRKSDKPQLALDLIRSLPFETRVVREEVTQFEELFSLLAERPKSLTYPEQTVIRVVTKPKLQVFVNGREIPKLTDKQDAIALIYMMNFPNKRINTDELAMAVFDFETYTENEDSFRDLTNRIIDRLRYKLEYPESIRDDRKSYWLDPETIWVHEALPIKT